MENTISASLWSEVSPKIKISQNLRGQAEADIVVIGGGFTGLSAALHLAKLGRKVIVLEAKTIGFGGSGRNNGQVIPVLSGPEPDEIETRYGDVGARFVELIRDSAQYFFQLAIDENIKCEAEQTGWFQPAHSNAHMRLSEKRVELWSKRGAPCSLLDKDECAKLLGSKNWYGGMLNPTGGHVNPLMYIHGLAKACEKYGVVIYENSCVNDIARNGEDWLIKTNDGQVKTIAIMQATNAYTHELAKSLSPKLAKTIIPVTSWQVATKPLSKEQQKTILVQRQAVSDTRSNLCYFRYDVRNRLVSGGALMLNANAKVRLQSIVGKRLSGFFPSLNNPQFTHIWSGYVGITKDRYPHFYQLEKNYWSFIGGNGRAIALCVSIGKEIAKVIDGTPIDEVALPFSEVKPFAFHGVMRRSVPIALAYYRWRDRFKPKL
jgi:glycine/D-amino acid oxidase-like deaminating enzyme